MRTENRFDTIMYPEPQIMAKYSYPNEGQVTAVLKTKSGVAGTFTLNGESIPVDLSVFTIYGTEGVLKLTNPNFFGGELHLLKMGAKGLEDIVVENDLPYSENSRGVGPSEMVDAIAEGRPNRACKELAFHVLDTIECIMDSSKTQAFKKVTSDYNETI